MRPFLSALVAALSLLTSVAAPAATLLVKTAVDTDAADGFCSLREAITAANTDMPRQECPAGSGADRILFDLPSLPATITLAAPLPEIYRSLALRGPGRSALTLDGAGLNRILRVNSAADDLFIEISDLTLANGFTTSEGGALHVLGGQDAWVRLERLELAGNVATLYGGAISFTPSVPTSSRLEIRQAYFHDNQASNLGGGALRIYDHSATIDATTFASNTTGGNGGAINLFDSALTLARSTLSGNSADDFGGAISGSDLNAPLALSLVDSTVTLNVAGADADPFGAGGGISFDGTAGARLLTLANTVLAGNSDLSTTAPNNPDIAGIDATDSVASTLSLVGDPTGADTFFPAGVPNVNGDYVGTAAAPLPAALEPLGNNGGPTPTHRPDLVAGSWVLDRGQCPGAEADQRGAGLAPASGRIVDIGALPNGPGSDGCDLGAVERGANAATALVLFDDSFENGTTLAWWGERP